MAIETFFVRGSLQANTQLVAGNSSVNAVCNSTGLTFSNSTVTTQINIASIATSTQFIANTAKLFLTTDQFWGAMAYQAISFATTIAWDQSVMINGTVTLTANATLGWPANMKIGQSGYIEVVQDGTGGRTLAFFANATQAFHFDTGTAPTIDTTLNHKTLLFYHSRSANIVLLSMPFQGFQ